MSFIRFANKFKTLLSRSLQTTRAFNKPVNAIFEMSNACNLRCPLCNTGGLRESFRHIERGSMKFETFKAGVDKLLPELSAMDMYNWGEPLLNKDLFKCIEYANRHGVKTRLSSNMMLYTEQIGRGLIESGLATLIVSCDGINQETYQKYRVGGDLSKLIDGVDNLIRLKKDLNSKYPLIEMQCIVFKFNENDMEEYRSYWVAKGVDSISFINMSFVSKIGKEVAEKNDLVPENKDYQPYHPYGNMKRCNELYGQITVDWNGDWYTCCFAAGEKAFKVGNIVTDDFYKLWNGKKYRYCRKLLRTQKCEGDYFETMCHDCTGCHPKPDTKTYWK